MKKFKDGYFSLIENVSFHDMFGNKRRKEYTSYLIYEVTGLSIILSDTRIIILIRLDKINYNNEKIWLLKYLKARSQKERDSIVNEGEDCMLKKMNEFVK